MKPVMTDFNGFASCGGGSALFRRAHGEGLRSGGSNNHNVKWTRLVVAVGVNEVGTFSGAMCSGHELLPVDGGMPPLVEEAVKNINDGVVSSNGSCAICAADGVVSVRVAV